MIPTIDSPYCPLSITNLPRSTKVFKTKNSPGCSRLSNQLQGLLKELQLRLCLAVPSSSVQGDNPPSTPSGDRFLENVFLSHVLFGLTWLNPIYLGKL